ncbi:MAG: ABC transporter permease [Dysgonamonadaceae bacterium]|jgi:ABC-2 type transport system permease protein|nr:ABC transporter permease [Dysgonamonadaceae bacterium]
MKPFFACVKKEFYHIIRDVRTVLILLVMPVAQIIIFGFAISTEVRNIRVAVGDPSNDASTQRLINEIDANPYFDITRTIDNPKQIDNLFRRDETDLVIVFEENFNENLLRTGEASLQLITDATEPNKATAVTSYAANVIKSYRNGINKGTARANMQISPEIKLLYNPQQKSAYNFVPGVMGLILMLICAMMTSISIVRERELGTMEVLLASPIKPISVILAKTVPYLTLSIVNLATLLLLSVFVLDVPVAGSLGLLSVLSLLFIFVALSLGLLISTIVNSQPAAMLVSGMVLMMPVMLLSGMIFPIESMPLLLQWISNIIPARWFIAAVKKIMIEGLGFTYVLKETAVLVSMIAVIMLISLKNFKYRLQ